jgi:hypothetical protein
MQIGVLVGKPQGKSPLGRPRCKWVDNIKIDFRHIGWEGMDWLDLEYREQFTALVNMVINIILK